jgi:hypothetical protein
VNVPAKPVTRKLTLDDIVDLRAYERERDEFRAHIVALKKRRRVSVGPFVSFVFENRDTVRFQVQEMARAERIGTDAGIQAELDAYNPLIPEPGTLSATMFIELTAKDDLTTWLPKLVGIERAAGIQLGDGPDAPIVRATPEAGHAQRLTRETTTASVHYVTFELGDEHAARASRPPVVLRIDHENYAHRAELGQEVLTELGTDLQT